MHLPQPAPPLDPTAQKRADARRLRIAFNLSLGMVLLLCAVFFMQPLLPVDRLAVAPQSWSGLVGILFAPLLHGGYTHLAMNSIAILMLGTLAGSVYPRATLRALPLMWIGAGLFAWWLGDANSRHLGASGVTHGLGFLLFTLGLLRRDRPAIAAGMLAFLFYGGMLLTVLPHEPGVSWESHMGGAVGGVIGAWLFLYADPLPPRKQYSWELEEEEDAEHRFVQGHDPLEPQRPKEVSVLWQREETPSHNVLPFRAPPRSSGHES